MNNTSFDCKSPSAGIVADRGKRKPPECTNQESQASFDLTPTPAALLVKNSKLASPYPPIKRQKIQAAPETLNADMLEKRQIALESMRQDRPAIHCQVSQKTRSYRSNAKRKREADQFSEEEKEEEFNPKKRANEVLISSSSSEVALRKKRSLHPGFLFPKNKTKQSFETPEPSEIDEKFYLSHLKAFDPVFKKHSISDHRAFIVSTQESLKKRTPACIVVTKESFDPDSPLSEEFLQSLQVLHEDIDVYYDDDHGSRKLLLSLRKNVFPAGLLEDLAKASFLCLPMGFERYRSSGGVFTDNPTTLFKDSPNNSVKYQVCVIDPKKKTRQTKNRYPISALNPAQKKSWQAYPGRIGKISQELVKDPIPTAVKVNGKSLDVFLASAEQIAAARFSTSNTFADGEKVIYPVETTLGGVFGYLSSFAKRGYVTSQTLHVEKFKFFERSLLFVDLCSAAYEIVAPKEYQKQQTFASTGLNLRGTPFSTFEVHVNESTGFHVDNNSANKEGLAAIIKIVKDLDASQPFNNDLMFPAFRLAAHLETGDLAFFNAEEVHGNPFLRVKSRKETKTPLISRRKPNALPKELDPASYAAAFILFHKAGLEQSTKNLRCERETPVSSSQLISRLEGTTIARGHNNEPAYWGLSNARFSLETSIHISMERASFEMMEKTGKLSTLLEQELGNGLQILGNVEGSIKQFDLDQLTDNRQLSLKIFDIQADQETIFIDSSMAITFLWQPVSSATFSTLFDIKIYDMLLVKDLLLTSQANIAKGYINGGILAPNYVKAAEWFRKVTTGHTAANIKEESEKPPITPGEES